MTEPTVGSVKDRLAEFYETISEDLDRSVQFWLKNSHDEECGGFFTCLDADGNVYDKTKMTWLMSRQIWMYARLYREMPRFHLPQILEAAKKGADFIMKHLKMEGSQKCYIFVTREGKPLKSQRSPFSEIFYTMAMAEMYRATKEALYKKEALAMMSAIEYWVRVDPSGMGAKTQPPVPTSALGIPMMLLCTIDILETMLTEDGATGSYTELAHWCVAQVSKHVQRNNTVVLETVTEDGQEMEGSEGRLINPGHAIESGWFLLERALKTKDVSLQELAIDSFMMGSFKVGWDEEHGGIFYMVDVDGKPPQQLQWDMKLYWPHNEAMIAFLMAYKATQKEIYLEKFAQVYDYSYRHFVDTHRGEWFGYLNREGKVSIQNKGGHWKGCFHVPRSLMMCEQMLKELLQSPAHP